VEISGDQTQKRFGAGETVANSPASFFDAFSIVAWTQRRQLLKRLPISFAEY
jgi:hypothetical protein